MPGPAARDPEAARRSAEALAALQAGGIPPQARERLTALRRGGGRFFTSDLSTSEFLLARQAGFRPLTQVMGSCFYAVGWQSLSLAGVGAGFGPGGVGPGGLGPRGFGQGGFGQGGLGYAAAGTYELEVQTEAWNEARRLALERLAQEARLAGADAVLGVEVRRGEYDWASGLIEFVAVGTAVVSERFDLGEEPLLSALTGQDFASLVRRGYLPVGIVAGTTVAYVVGGPQTMQALTGIGARMRNQELTELTHGLYDARAAAMRRVVRQAHEVGAAGLVGLRLDRHEHAREVDQQGWKRLDLVVTMHALGTAIVPLAPNGEQPPTYIALSLSEEHR